MIHERVGIFLTAPVIFDIAAPLPLSATFKTFSITDQGGGDHGVR